MKDNELQIDFKVGSTKMFKISDLVHFVENVGISNLSEEDLMELPGI